MNFVTLTERKSGNLISIGIDYIIMVEPFGDDSKVSLAWGAGIITHTVIDSHDEVMERIEAASTLVALAASESLEVGQRDGADRPLALVPEEPCEICGAPPGGAHDGYVHSGEDPDR